MRERMKKAGLLAAFVFLAGLMLTAIDTQQAVALHINPSLKDTDALRHRVLLWVYNADNVAHEDGDVVVWTDGSVADGLEITTTTTANNGLVAGVVAPDTIAATAYGFIQLSGYHDGVTIGVANSAGDSLVTSTTGESAGLYTIAMATGAAANQAAIDTGVFGVAFEATTTSTTVKAIIKCL
jgi:hypothetical protein